MVNEEQKYYLGASRASEQRSLQIHSFSVRLKQIALKTVYCRFSAVYTWFLVAIQTPVLPHWQPVLCLQIKVYIHERNAVINILKVVAQYKAGTQTTHTFQFYTYYLVLIIISYT